MQVTNSGGPGSLIGAAYSTDNTSGLTSDVPLRDYGKIRNTTGSYPWRIDEDYSTIISITNVGNQAARFQVEIRFPGGPYSIRPRQLAIGETATFDLRQMRDQGQPDRTGKTLPSDIDQGQFHWSIVATPGDAHLIGRAEVVSQSARVVSSYSCPVCCPDSGPFGGFDPSGYGLSVDGFAATNSNGQFIDCYFNSYPTNIWWSSLSTWDSSIATFMTGSEDLHGEGTGFTYGVGTYDYIYYDNDGMDCYQRSYTNTDYADVNVTPKIDNITPALGPVDSSVGISIVGSGFGNSPTVNVGGGGITANVQSSSETSISVTLNISADASAGNHGITVTSNGQQSNSMNFFVQLPTKLQRNSISALQNAGGCGGVKNLSYTLLDQNGDPIDTNSKISEGISGYNGPQGLQPASETEILMSHGTFQDVVGYNTDTCPPPFTATFVQSFTVHLNTPGHAWALSSRNSVSMGRTSAGAKFVDIIFTQ